MNRASAQNRYKYLLCSVAFVFLLLLFSAFAIEGEPTSELNKRGLNLMKEGKPLEARKLHEEALLIQERELGPSHFDVATTLENLAETYRNPVENSEPTSDHAKARQLYKRALKIREALLGLNDVSLCKLLHHIGDTYNKSALHEQAHPFHDRALGISELTYGREHSNTIHSLNRLADTFRNAGDQTKALELFGRVLAIQEKNLGPEDLKTAAAISQLARSYRNMGNYAQELEMHERALAIIQKKLGPDHESAGDVLHGMGITYVHLGDFEKARVLIERALEVQKKSSRPESANVGNLLCTLASIHSDVGDYDKALQFREQALRILEKTLGPDHPSTAHTMDNHGLTYSKMGNEKKALELSIRALAVIEKAYGHAHPSTAHILRNCAGSYLKNGDTLKARELYEQVLAIRKKAYGPDHPFTAETLTSLSNTFDQDGDHLHARDLQIRALKIYENALGSNHLETAEAMDDLAGNYATTGDYDKARELYEKALTVFEAVLGPQHSSTASTLLQLASVLYMADQTALARSYAARAASALDRNLQSALLSDEETRLTWQEKNLSVDLLACLLRPEQIAQLSLRWKGVVMDSLLEDRAVAKTFAKDKDTAKQLKDLQTLQNKLSRVAFNQERTNESAGIIEQISAIQRKMANRTHVFGRVRASADLTLDSILPALSGGVMFVDFIEFSDPKLSGDAKLHYGVNLLTEDGNPIFIRIPDRAGIDNAIDAVHSSLQKRDEKLLLASLSELSEKLWKPIANKIPPSIQRLIICPDGKLNFVSFAALLDQDEKFVCEKYLLNYVATARDSSPAYSGLSNKAIAIFANPAFDTHAAEIFSDRITMRSSEVSAFGKVKLPALPGTAAESESLNKTAASLGWATNTFVGKEASEKHIRSIHHVAILHLATHGFYLQSQAPIQEASRAIHLESTEASVMPIAKRDGTINPMRASGIALAGAQSTFTSWKEGVTPDPENDGILMAEEVAGLNLEGTWLVSLSACETGVGEARSGEGVFGLRRAFMMAGAQNLLMTLWPVNDSTTTDIMADFYEKCLATGNPTRSLAETQRDWLLKLRKERGILAAVGDAGAFVMTSPGIKNTNFSMD